MKEENKFYVYVYLNPLKSGIFSYIENGIGIDFNYAPFYIGKGHDSRLFDHLYEAKSISKYEFESIQEEKPKYNKHKINTINKIHREDKEVIVYKIYENLDEETAYLLEKFFIKLIGRADKKLGILTNMTDGGEGSVGRICTKETRIKMSDSAKIKIFTDTHKKNISEAVSKDKNPMFGRNDQCYGENGIATLAKLNINKKYEEIYGEEKSITIKNKIKISCSKPKINKKNYGKSGKENPMFGRNDQCYGENGIAILAKKRKGKNDVEVYGEEKAKEISLKRSKGNSNENNNFAKIKESEVLEIKQLLKNTSLSIKEIALFFNTSYSIVYNIKNGRTWKYLD
jgi:DNA-binding transcriptional regulator YiaG